MHSTVEVDVNDVVPVLSKFFFSRPQLLRFSSLDYYAAPFRRKYNVNFISVCRSRFHRNLDLLVTFRSRTKPKVSVSRALDKPKG